MSRRAVVLSFDRIHLGYLGCYGNEWMETPHFDRLATEAVVFDRHFAENVDPGAVNHAWWTGKYQSALDHDRQSQESSAWLTALHEAGVATALLAEHELRDSSRVAPPFDEVHTVDGIDSLETAETDVPFARLVVRAAEWIAGQATSEQPALVWLKSRGVPVPWIPPQEFADLYLSEFGLAAEPEVRDEDELEDDMAGAEESEEEEEPDDVPEKDLVSERPALGDRESGTAEGEASVELRYARALYAAYVTYLDRWLGKLLAELRRWPDWNDALVIVTAAMGQSLAEHSPLGDDQPLVREEWIHTPLFVRIPGGEQACTRRQALVQTVDIVPTLVEWFQQADIASGAGRPQSLLNIIRNECDSIRQYALVGNGTEGECGVRSDDFLYVTHRTALHDAEDPSAMLFEKPYDRWDQSSVLSQYPQMAQSLHEQLRSSVEQIERQVSSMPTAGNAT